MKVEILKLIKSILVASIIVAAVSGSAFAAETLVSYCTDAEGDFGKLTRFFKDNPAFRLGADGLYHLEPGAVFVFGGDAPDRGAGSIRVMRELTRLKAESGDRVFLIAGNRDINKTRLARELAPEWRPKLALLQSWSDWAKEKNLLAPHADLSAASSAFADMPQRLRWILERTMGAPKAFDFMRQELAILAGVAEAQISDMEVTAAFRREYSPAGVFGRYINSTQLAARVGNTLFIHGGIPSEALGTVPNIQEKEADFDRWLKALNTWLKASLESWKQSSEQGEWNEVADRNLETLNDYAKPPVGQKINAESILQGKTAGPNNEPYLPSDHVIEVLMKLGIHRLVVGHSPIGSVPFVLRAKNGFEMVWADNSYSATETHAARVLLSGDGLVDMRVDYRIDGLEADLAARIETKLGENSVIGRMLPSGEIVLGIRADGKLLLGKVVRGFKIEYRTVLPSEIPSAEFLLDARAPSACEALLQL